MVLRLATSLLLMLHSILALPAYQTQVAVPEMTQHSTVPLMAEFIVAPAPAPEHFMLNLQTDIDGVGVVSINVTRSWAPKGVDHLYALVKDHFYDGAAFFRVVSDFIVQFGIAGTPAENTKWQAPILDDPVVKSNLQWTVSYATAGPNTRTTQLFINFKDNSQLDKEGFAPLGEVVTGTQFLLRVHDPTPGNPDGVDQAAYEQKGDTWLRQQYPEINFIKKIEIKSEMSETSEERELHKKSLFMSWVSEHNKGALYDGLSDREVARRFEVYKTNLKFIDAHNQRFTRGQETFTLAMNSLGATTRDEFKRMHRAKARARAIPSKISGASENSAGAGASVLPASWDWRQKGAVTTVKNQFEPVSCGACWAFSAVAGMEGKYFIDGNQLTSFSAQELVDCTLGGKDTCNQGGEMHDGVMEVAKNQHQRINTNSQYPYTGKSKGVCHFNTATALLTNITGYSNVTVGDEQALMQAVVTGVIPAAINADADAFMFYSGGVIDVKNCPSKPQQLDHGVAIVGYGTTHLKEPYWLVKNSYGEYWGEKGYFRITRGKNMCGIATDCILVL